MSKLNRDIKPKKGLFINLGAINIIFPKNSSPGWMDGSKSQCKDCLQQSEIHKWPDFQINFIMKCQILAIFKKLEKIMIQKELNQFSEHLPGKNLVQASILSTEKFLFSGKIFCFQKIPTDFSCGVPIKNFCN